MAEIEGRTGRIPEEELPRYREAFDELDKNKSGFIEKEEIQDLLANLDLKIPGHQLRTLKEEYGEEIDFEEFKEVSQLLA
ncbi:troponin C-like [Exaiptasia diaphana]|uniref:EF-hand domain-containing protein n=1 Tax=Exaiptasia diaphana TaxID=2652724 RepID=A0A913YRM7_EXADI|nr:troponin C-like [Exaiptasia diaphana]